MIGLTSLLTASALFFSTVKVDIAKENHSPPFDQVQQTVQVTMRGKLLAQPSFPFGGPGWRVIGAEISYGLHLPDATDVEKLAKFKDKIVIVTGTLETRRYENPFWDSGFPHSRFTELVVLRVTSLEVAGNQDRAEFVEKSVIDKTFRVEFQGKLEQQPPLGGPEWHVSGPKGRYELYIADAELQKLAEQLKGKTVLVKGVLEKQRYSLPGIGLEDRGVMELVVLRVNSLQAANPDDQPTHVKEPVTLKTVEVSLKGHVSFYRHIRFGRGAVRITAGEQQYWMDFGKHDDLYKLAGKANGDKQLVVVTGTIRPTDRALVVTGFRFAD